MERVKVKRKKRWVGDITKEDDILCCVQQASCKLRAASQAASNHLAIVYRSFLRVPSTTGLATNRPMHVDPEAEGERNR